MLNQLGSVLSDGDFCARYPFIRQIFDIGDLLQLADLKEKAAAPTATDSEDNQ